MLSCHLRVSGEVTPHCSWARRSGTGTGPVTVTAEQIAHLWGQPGPRESSRPHWGSREAAQEHESSRDEVDPSPNHVTDPEARALCGFKGSDFFFFFFICSCFVLFSLFLFLMLTCLCLTQGDLGSQRKT